MVLPDVLHGKALDMGSFDRSKFAEWLKQFPRDKVFADCIKVIDELKASHGVKNVGVEGFCWGGLYAVLLAGCPHSQLYLYLVILSTCNSSGDFITCMSVHACVRSCVHACVCMC